MSDPTRPIVERNNIRPNDQPNVAERDPTNDLTLAPQPAQVDMEALAIPVAAERLGLTTDAVRMRLKRGTLAGRKVEGRWVVLVPRANDDPTGTEREESEPGAATQRSTQREGEHPNATRELIDRLLSENAYLRATLDAEIEARRRADHLVAGRMERLPELAATIEMPQEHAVATERDENASEVSDSLIDRLRRLVGR
jgi:hypothetical protein